MTCGNLVDLSHRFAKGQLTMQDQIFALELADMWEFDEVRSKLITKLGSQALPAVERISLGRRLHLASWMKEGYKTLCTQHDPPSEEVGERLGWKSYLEVAKVRESTNTVRAHDPFGRRLPLGVSIEERIEKLFKEELRLDPTYKPENGNP